MLKLKQPIHLGDKTYEGFGVVKVMVEHRARRIEYELGLIDEQEDCLVIAILEQTGQGLTLRAPVVVGSGEIHDLQQDDAAIAAILYKFMMAGEGIEALLVANRKLQDLYYELGELRFPLDAEFVTCPTKPFRTRINKPINNLDQGT